MVKSGTDFRDLSLIELGLKQSKCRPLVSRIEHYIVDSKVAEDEDVASLVKFYTSLNDTIFDKFFYNYSKYAFLFCQRSN